MMFNFRRVFHPTSEEQKEDRLFWNNLIANARAKKLCCACIHFYDHSTSLSTEFGCELGYDDTAICRKNEGKCAYWESDVKGEEE